MLKKNTPPYLQVRLSGWAKKRNAKFYVRALKYAIELDVDYAAIHPITPVPGTELWKKRKMRGG
jgi:radical SAM superfamily enzyme YgiQ (UPF0313 family)